MTAQELKNSILQLAMQGKLVEQRLEEGTSKTLLAQIKVEKEQLIKDKKIKKEKPLPEITNEEKPFEIPESWEWVRWGELSYSIQYGYNAPALDVGDIKMVRISDIKDNEVQWQNVPFCKIPDENIEKYLLETNDILFARTGGTVGKSYLVREINEKAVYAGYLIRTRYNSSKLIPEYLKFFMESELYWKQLRNGTIATAQPNCNGQTLANMIIPIPAFEEQKRIVSKIEEILPYIEQYDKAYTKLEAFNKKFPEDMKKSVLQLAMQGKLVEQHPEEGTVEELYQHIVEEKAKLIKEGKIKKEKPLAEITYDEIPFEIPESWKWVRLNELCEKIGSGSTPLGGRNVYKEKGIKFLRSQNVYNDGLRYEGLVYISEEQNKLGSIVKAKDLLLNITGGSIGRCAIVPDDFDLANINQHVMIIRSVNLDLRFWIHTVIISSYIQNKIMDVQVGVSREGLSAEKLKNFLIPLPPLAEQKRIVARIEEILPYCEQLMK